MFDSKVLKIKWLLKKTTLLFEASLPLATEDHP